MLIKTFLVILSLSRLKRLEWRGVKTRTIWDLNIFVLKQMAQTHIHPAQARRYFSLTARDASAKIMIRLRVYPDIRQNHYLVRA